MLKLIFLSESFYNDYASYSEIEQKQHRPHIQIQIELDGIIWAIPMRSNINHTHAVWTDAHNRCGIDLTKAVPVLDQNHIDFAKKPYIRPNEFKALKRISEHQLRTKFAKYISQYKNASQNLHIERNKKLVNCSTLQYFESLL